MRTIEEAIKQYKHICWYPSAGRDFRELLYLSEWYYDNNNVPRDDGQVLPDLFILTDVMGLPACYDIEFNNNRDNFLKPGFCLFDDGTREHSTKITIKDSEELESAGFSVNPEFSFVPNRPIYNLAWLLKIEVESQIQGVITKYDVSVLYVDVQNEYFAHELLIPKNIEVEYLVLVRYGVGTGGANIKPSWIIKSYKTLGIKYLIANDKYITYAENPEEYDYPMPLFSYDKPMPIYESIYSIDGIQWSEYGPVIWYKFT